MKIYDFKGEKIKNYFLLTKKKKKSKSISFCWVLKSYLFINIKILNSKVKEKKYLSL
jgi:hypothetical protein